MLSQEDLANKTFKTGRGYDKKEVDAFVSEVKATYEEFSRSKLEMKDQIQTLTEALQHYKTIEASLQKALILAEKTADETIETAKRKAQEIEREAMNNAAMYTADSKSELEIVQSKTITLVQEYVKHKANFNKLLQEEHDLLNDTRFEIVADELLAFKPCPKPEGVNVEKLEQLKEKLEQERLGVTDEADYFANNKEH